MAQYVIDQQPASTALNFHGHPSPPISPHASGRFLRMVLSCARIQWGRPVHRGFRRAVFVEDELSAPKVQAHLLYRCDDEIYPRRCRYRLACDDSDAVQPLPGIRGQAQAVSLSLGPTAQNERIRQEIGVRHFGLRNGGYVWNRQVWIVEERPEAILLDLVRVRGIERGLDPPERVGPPSSVLGGQVRPGARGANYPVEDDGVKFVETAAPRGSAMAE